MGDLPWINFNKFDDAEIEALRHAFASAPPYPHLVLDELFSREALRDVLREFDTPSPWDWRDYQSSLQTKRGTAPNTNLPPVAQNYFNFIYSGPFIRFLSRITGIKNLIPDPELHGAGMHEVGTGGHFQIHVDFLKHPKTGLTNRLALITYLNEDWTEADGGALEFWDMAPPRPAVRVLPHFGRTVIMEQSARAAHGHPTAVRDGRKRRSIIAYFYTADTAARSDSDILPTTYVPHRGYTAQQQAELYIRRVAPRFVVNGVKAVHRAIRPRRD